MSSFKPPENFIPGNSPAEAWDRWRLRFEIYFEASDLASKPVTQQRAILLHVLGDAGLELYSTLTILETGELRTTQVILNAITSHYSPFRNTTFKRHLFFTASQAENQSIDDFTTELKSKGRDCEFGDLYESLIRDRLICGIRSEQLRERLLREAKLTLGLAIDICRADENSKLQSKVINTSESETLYSVTRGQSSCNPSGTSASRSVFASRTATLPNKNFFRKATPQRHQQQRSFNQQCYQRNCTNCLQNHPPRQCPAFGKLCHQCNKPNHFGVACRTNPIHSLQEEDCTDNELFLGAISLHGISSQKDWIEDIIIQGDKLPFKLDTGSHINVLPAHMYRKLRYPPQLLPSNKVITVYSGHKLDVVGECSLQCIAKNTSATCRFSIIETSAPAILGLETSERLNLISRLDSIITESPQRIIDEYSDVFEGIGKLPGTYSITLKKDAIPAIHAARRIPFSLQDKVKDELQRMEKLGIITKVSKPTDWVSPITIVSKANGKVRICLDPRQLNESIKREHYKLPTQDDIFSKLEGATVFTVLDATSAFWQIQLDEPSSYLCTFATPYGRYRFLRMPYGISSAPEIFQRAMNDLYPEQKGKFPYFDDLLVWGSDLRDHNRHLKEALQIARDKDLKLGKEKIQLAKSEIDYIGHKISMKGIEIQTSKVEAISQLKTPTTKQELQRFLGMVNYVARFIPNLSSLTSYLRQLLHKKTAWTWDSQAEASFEELKRLVSTAPVLSYYNQTEEITLSADASQHGLGTVMMQKSKPVAYASASLSDTQKAYAQIEKELLAVLFACEHFHIFIYGKKITIETDHKPLISITTKPMHLLSPRIQRMVLRLMRYQFKLIYVPGKQLYTADTLSRDSRGKLFDTPYLEGEASSVHSLISVSEEREFEMKEATKQDPTLQKLQEFIHKGWPSHVSALPPELKPYWPHNNELHESSGLIFRGQRLVVPQTQKAEVLEKIHMGHLGITLCKAKARESLYWPNMTEEIEAYIKSCDTCQEYSRSNMKEPLMPHEIPDLPWQKVGTDFMQLGNKTYIVTVDYLTKFVEVQHLNSTTAEPTINALKSMFARHGIPMTIFSDNGPPFNSYEFKSFTKLWEIKHVTSSPKYPQSNGLVERTIQTLKGILGKALKENKDLYLALLNYRSCPRPKLPSPAMMLMGRKIRTLLPGSKELLQPKYDTSKVKQVLKERQNKMYQNIKSRQPLCPLYQGSPVWLQVDKRKWVQATVIAVANAPRSYLVQTTGGNTYRRNRIHLRQREQRKGTIDDPKSSKARPEKEKPKVQRPLNLPKTLRHFNQDFERQPVLPREQAGNILTAPVRDKATLTTRSGRTVKPPAKYAN